VILGVIIFGESPSWLQLLGVAAILTGLVLTTRRRATVEVS
jgi:LPXTG-motif cell wall-anchored protein